MADQPSVDHPLDQLRLTVMQDVLPVGLAVVDRVRQGGPAKVVEAFNGSVEGSLETLREEGEPAARSLRDLFEIPHSRFTQGSQFFEVSGVELHAQRLEALQRLLQNEQPELVTAQGWQRALLTLAMALVIRTAWISSRPALDSWGPAGIDQKLIEPVYLQNLESTYSL